MFHSSHGNNSLEVEKKSHINLYSSLPLIRPSLLQKKKKKRKEKKGLIKEGWSFLMGKFSGTWYFTISMYLKSDLIRGWSLVVGAL
jgi:hypothetical protein